MILAATQLHASPAIWWRGSIPYLAANNGSSAHVVCAGANSLCGKRRIRRMPIARIRCFSVTFPYYFLSARFASCSLEAFAKATPGRPCGPPRGPEADTMGYLTAPTRTAALLHSRDDPRGLQARQGGHGGNPSHQGPVRAQPTRRPSWRVDCALTKDRLAGPCRAHRLDHATNTEPLIPA